MSLPREVLTLRVWIRVRIYKCRVNKARKIVTVPNGYVDYGFE